MDFSKAIYERRSIRSFKETALSETQIIELLDAARMSPSAKNRQPWKYFVFRGKEKGRIAELMETAISKENVPVVYKTAILETCRAIRTAFVLFLVCSRDQSQNTRNDYLSIRASMENMCLKALDMELGSLWIGDIDIAEADIVQEFGLNLPIVSALAIGYPNEAPYQRPRLSISEISEWVSIKNERRNINTTRVYQNSEKYVFISYSHNDKPIVDADIAELKRHGVPIWIDDSMIAGTEWNKVAIKHITDPNCVCVIFYLSQNSILSKPVAKELRAALKRFGRPKVYDKSDSFPVLGYFSVNIGGSSPSAMYKELKELSNNMFRIPWQIYNLFTKAFPDNVKYISRDPGILECSHIEEMLDVLEMYDIVTPGVYDEFTYDVLPTHEICITKYTGNSSTAAVVDRISGMPVTELGANAFCNNNELRTVYIPDSLRMISDGAFRGLSLLDNVKLPKTLEKLGAAAFRDTQSLKKVDLPKSLKVLEEALFRDSAIIEIVVPEGVERLEEAVFAGCSSLKRVVIPDSVVEMTEGGFRGCCSLEELIIPRNIRGLNRDSFSDCPKVDIIIGNIHFHDGTSDIIED